jgi:hypothetical protein
MLEHFQKEWNRFSVKKCDHAKKPRLEKRERPKPPLPPPYLPHSPGTPVGAIAVVVIRHKATGKAIKYTVSDRWLQKLAEWNRTLDARGRYDAVMKAEGLFEGSATD